MEGETLASDTESASAMSSVTNLLFGSPLNTVLTVICAYFIYKLLKGNSDSGK